MNRTLSKPRLEYTPCITSCIPWVRLVVLRALVMGLARADLALFTDVVGVLANAYSVDSAAFQRSLARFITSGFNASFIVPSKDLGIPHYEMRGDTDASPVYYTPVYWLAKAAAAGGGAFKD